MVSNFAKNDDFCFGKMTKNHFFGKKKEILDGLQNTIFELRMLKLHENHDLRKVQGEFLIFFIYALFLKSQLFKKKSNHYMHYFGLNFALLYDRNLITCQ